MVPFTLEKRRDSYTETIYIARISHIKVAHLSEI